MAGKRGGLGEGVSNGGPGAQRRGLALGAEALAQVPECFLCQEGEDLGPAAFLLGLASHMEPVDTGHACEEQMFKVPRAKRRSLPQVLELLQPLLSALQVLGHLVLQEEPEPAAWTCGCQFLVLEVQLPHDIQLQPRPEQLQGEPRKGWAGAEGAGQRAVVRWGCKQAVGPMLGCPLPQQP